MQLLPQVVLKHPSTCDCFVFIDYFNCIKIFIRGTQHMLELEWRSVECMPPPPTLTFDLDLPKFNHLVPVAKGMTDEV